MRAGDHNKHGEARTALSKGLLGRRNDTELEAIQKSIYSYVRRVAKAKSNDVLWTTLKDYQIDFSGKGYSKGFTALNLRFTNDYSDCLAATGGFR